MAEKNLNTRIKLRYDSLQAWAAANPTLLDGEIAIAYLPPKGEGQAPAATSEAVLFKVGPGAFNSLPWASALAADVYDWAKLTYSDFLKEIEKTFYTETEINTLLAGYYTKSEVEGLIEAAESRAATDAKNKADKALEDAKSYADTEIQKAVTGGTAGLATEKYVNDAVAPKADKTYVDAELAKKLDKTTYEAYIDGKSMSDAELKTYAENQASAAQTAAEATAASALSAARTAITTEIGQAVAPLATTEALNNVDAKFADYTKTAELPTDLGDFTNNAGYAKTADVVTNDEFIAFEGTNAQAIAAAEQNAKDYADDIKEAILGEGIKDTFDTLVEIQTWIEGAGVNATELTEAIAAEAKIREDADKALNENKLDKTAYNTDKEAQAQKDAAQDKALTDAIAAEVQRADGKYATEADLTLAEGRIEELEKKPGLDKVGTVTSVSAGTGLTGGTITESGTIALSAETIASLAKADTALQEHQDISGKANKVTGATADNFAGLDAEGNLTDSGFKAEDFVQVGNEIVIGNFAEEDGTKYSGEGMQVNYAGAIAKYHGLGFSIDGGVSQFSIIAESTAEPLKVQGSEEVKQSFNEWLGFIDDQGEKTYATAAQGEKANSALQEITAGTGLKVSTKEDNKQQIDFDDTVTFIFNCGGASL